MTFELLEKTKAKLTDVVVLSQKNRQPDENPGAKLTLAMDLPSDALAHFDGHLRGFLFERSTGAKQGALDGMEGEALTGIGKRIGTMRWDHELTGYELVVDLGLGGKRSNLEIADCKLSGWRLTPKEGGSATVKVNLESPDVSEQAFGKLAKLKSRDIEFTLTPPQAAQQELQAGDKAPQRTDAAAGEPPRPFPKGDKPAESPPQSATVEQQPRGSTRTARGREKTAKALAAGQH